MELSHRDQMESSAAGGFLPANTHHPVTFHCGTTLYLFTTLEEEMSSFVQVLQLQGSEVILRTKTMIAYLAACLLHCLLTIVSSFVFSCEKANLWPVHRRG